MTTGKNKRSWEWKDEENKNKEEVGETAHCGERNYVNVAIESMTSTAIIMERNNDSQPASESERDDLP